MNKSLKELLSSGRRLVGMWTMIPHPVPSEALGYTGCDFLVIDMEHALFTEGDVVSCLRAIGTSDVAPLIRLPGHDPVLVKRILDAGATSLMFPMVENAEQAEVAVQSTRYPPNGNRGFAFMHRASGYGTNREYAETVAAKLCVILQVESPTAIQRIPELAQVAGVDAIFVGPGDLSAALGCHGQISRPAVLDQLQAAVTTCRKLKKPIGTVAPTAEAACDRFDMGFDFVSVSNDLQFIMRGATEQTSAVREYLMADQLRDT